MVILPAPVFDDHACLGQGEQLLAIEAFVAQAGIEALSEAVLPRATRINVDRFNLLGCQPSPQLLLNELRSVVAADVFWRPVLGNQSCHDLAHLAGVDPAIHVDASALVGVFIDHGEHA